MRPCAYTHTHEQTYCGHRQHVSLHTQIYTYRYIRSIEMIAHNRVLVCMCVLQNRVRVLI